MYGNILTLYIEQVEELLSQFEWKSRDSLTETRLTDRYRSADYRDSRQFPARRTDRRLADDVTYTMYAALPIHRVRPDVRGGSTGSGQLCN